MPQETFDSVEAWSRERLEMYQLDQVREVVSDALERVPFYRRLWSEAGVGIGHLHSLEDLQPFPMVTKEDLIQAGEMGLHAGKRGPVGFSTRGTSGEPLLLWLDRDEEEAYIVPTMRGFRWAGFRQGMTALLMSPVWHRLAACEGHSVVRLGGRAAFFWGSLVGSQSVDAYLKALCEIRPAFVTTTAPFLLSVVRHCDEEGADVRELFGSVHSIVAVGLPLTPQLREHLQRRLGVANVFERSGTQEGAALDECASHTAPHIHEDVCYLEVVDGDGKPVPPGIRGNLLVTKLIGSGSPFIRYDTGDIAAFLPNPCPCGRVLRRLKIYGRPESSVVVGEKRITAYDVRFCVDEDPDLVGRNVLLVREGERPLKTLAVAIEGEAINAKALEARLCERLGVEDVVLFWLGNVRISWGFRQVIERSALNVSGAFGNS